MSEWKKWTDKTPVSDEAIIDHFQRLIHYISCVMSRSYKLQEEDRQDIVSAAQLALLRLPQDKRPLEGYCKTTINNAARNSIISRMSRGATSARQWRDYATMSYADAAPSNDPYTEDDTDAIDRISPTVSPENALTASITLDMAMARLDDRDREIVKRYYIEEQTFEAVAEQLGVSTPTVRKLLESAMSKLKARLT